MQFLRNTVAFYSKTVLPLFVWCIVLALLSLHPASARSQFPLQRCSVSLRVTERDSLKVQVYCDGSRRLSRQKSFFEMPQTPWQIFPGLEVFGKDETGKRSLVSIDGLDIQLFNSDFPDHLSQTFSISSPVSIINSTVLITNTHFLSSTTAVVSGGILVKDSLLTVQNCSFSGSLKVRDPCPAGAIYATSGSTLIIQNSLLDKMHSEEASILLAANSSVFLSESVFKQNQGNTGAAVLVKDGGTASVTHCNFSLCASSSTGALTVIDGRKLLLANSSFSGNSGKYGGALHVSANRNKQSAMEIRDSSFKNNTAEVNGGALYIASTTAQILGSHFESNTANFSGAGLYITRAIQITMRSSSFVKNNIKTLETDHSSLEDYRDAGCGSAIFVTKANQILLRNLNLSNNAVPKSGGAGYFRDVRSLEITDSILVGNEGRDHSGLSIHEVGTFTMVNTSVVSHVARSHTGGIYIRSTLKVKLLGVSFFNNRAGKAGAAAMSVKECKDVEIRDCHMYRNFGYLAATGGLEIVSAATLKISETTIHSNLAVSAAGAAIVAMDVTESMVIESSSIRNNSAKFGRAGACFIQGSKSLAVISSSFLYNVGHKFGGALNLIEADKLILESANFTGNEAGSGGAIAADCLRRLNINRSYLMNNKASVSFGGALMINAVSHASVSHTIFIQNSAVPSGGGILANSIRDNLDFIGKKWPVTTEAHQSHGGAMFIGQYKTVTIEDSIFRYNNASKNGGALFFAKSKSSSEARLKLMDIEFSNNRAHDGAGGAVVCENFDSLAIKGCEFNGNMALEVGGAVVIKHGISASLVNAIFTKNSLFEKQEQYRAHPSSKQFSSIYKQRQQGTRSQQSISISPPSDRFGRSLSYWDNGGLLDKIHVASEERSDELKNGGAVVVASVSQLKVKTTFFFSNYAPNSGGALAIKEIDSFLGTNNSFIENEATSNGGSVFIKGASTIILRSSLFFNNEVSARRMGSQMVANGDGGSVYFSNCRQVGFIKNQFFHNQAPGRGGAGFLNDIANLTIRKCLLEENLASFGGGLYFTEAQTVIIDETNFTRNGHALNSSTKSPDLERAVQNSETDSFLTRDGGAVAVTRSQKITVTSSNFYSNSAMGQGGALHWKQIDTSLLEKVKFVDNIARAGGGAVSIKGASVTLLNSNFTHNQGFKGGSIVVVSGEMKAENVNSYGNYADFDGGMVFCQDYSRISFTSSKFERDLSGNGSAFKAHCGCQLRIIDSEGICSNATTEDCEVAKGTPNCSASVSVKEAMHYLRPCASHAVSEAAPKTEQIRQDTNVSTSRKVHTQPKAQRQSRDVQKQTVIVEQPSNCETWDPVHLVLLAAIATLLVIVLACFVMKGSCTGPWKRQTQLLFLEDSANESDDFFMHAGNRDPAPVLTSLRRQSELLVPFMKDISLEERPFWDVSHLPSSIPPTYTMVRGKAPLVSHFLHNVDEVCSPTASQHFYELEPRGRGAQMDGKGSLYRKSESM